MAGHELQELEDMLATVAAEERYADAARLKARIDALSERDVSASVVLQMDELLENEQCAQTSCLAGRQPAVRTLRAMQLVKTAVGVWKRHCDLPMVTYGIGDVTGRLMANRAAGRPG